MKKVLKDLILFLTAYCIYIALEVTFRGYSYILMGIVAGISFLLIDSLNNNLSWDMPVTLQMALGCIFITILEIISGEFALRVLDVRMWDYSNMWGNAFDALFCPLFSFLWYLLSGVAIILGDAINYYVLHDDPRPYYRIWSWSGKKYYLLERICYDRK